MAVILLAPISYGVSLNLLRQFNSNDLTVLLAFALRLAALMLLTDGWIVGLRGHR